VKALYSLVGTHHVGAASFVAILEPGEPLTLVREPENPHDENAVLVWARGRRVGYVRATQVRALALKMDSSGKAFVGKLVKTPEGPQIEVEE
jgi:hypothetical protein